MMVVLNLPVTAECDIAASIARHRVDLSQQPQKTSGTAF